MKILAIRGKNLASLAGDFEVDFTVEPLKMPASLPLQAVPVPVSLLCWMLCVLRCSILLRV